MCTYLVIDRVVTGCQLASAACKAVTFSSHRTTVCSPPTVHCGPNSVLLQLINQWVMLWQFLIAEHGLMPHSDSHGSCCFAVLTQLPVVAVFPTKQRCLGIHSLPAPSCLDSHLATCQVRQCLSLTTSAVGNGHCPGRGACRIH